MSLPVLGQAFNNCILIDCYSHSLGKQTGFLLNAEKGRFSDTEMDELEIEWREMYPWAWAEFFLFLQGWSPGHWKINHYSTRMTEKVLNQL